jgi:hypothetical protein
MDEWESGGNKIPPRVKDYLDGLYNTKLGKTKTEPLRPRKSSFNESMKPSLKKQMDDLDVLYNIILKYVKDPQEAEQELDSFTSGGFDTLGNSLQANLQRDREFNDLKIAGMFRLKEEKIKPKMKKQTTDSKLAEIEKAGKAFVIEAQIEALSEIIKSKTQRISMISEDENLLGLVDSKKVKEMQREIKLLEKQRSKLERLYEKSYGKSYSKKEMVDEDMAEDAPKEFEDLVDKAERLYDKLGTVDAVLKLIPSKYKFDIERHLKLAYGNE